MDQKVKKAPLTVITGIQSAVNQCLADFFLAKQLLIVDVRWRSVLYLKELIVVRP